MNEQHMIERKAFIFNKQKYNLYDGPGVRSMVLAVGLACQLVRRAFIRFVLMARTSSTEPSSV